MIELNESDKANFLHQYPLIQEFINVIKEETAYGKFYDVGVSLQYRRPATDDILITFRFYMQVKLVYSDKTTDGFYIGYDYAVPYKQLEYRIDHAPREIDFKVMESIRNYKIPKDAYSIMFMKSEKPLQMSIEYD